MDACRSPRCLVFFLFSCISNDYWLFLSTFVAVCNLQPFCRWHLAGFAEAHPPWTPKSVPWQWSCLLLFSVSAFIVCTFLTKCAPAIKMNAEFKSMDYLVCSESFLRNEQSMVRSRAPKVLQHAPFCRILAVVVLGTDFAVCPSVGSFNSMIASGTTIACLCGKSTASWCTWSRWKMLWSKCSSASRCGVGLCKSARSRNVMTPHCTSCAA